jgi:hypothetical protein
VNGGCRGNGITQSNGATETKQRRKIFSSLLILRSFVALCESVPSLSSVSVASLSSVSVSSVCSVYHQVSAVTKMIAPRRK